MRQVALHVHLALLALGRRRQRDDAKHARAHALGDRLDRAALAGAVAALEHDADLESLVLHPLLQLDQLDVQLLELSRRSPCRLSFVVRLRCLAHGIHPSSVRFRAPCGDLRVQRDELVHETLVFRMFRDQALTWRVLRLRPLRGTCRSSVSSFSPRSTFFFRSSAFGRRNSLRRCSSTCDRADLLARVVGRSTHLKLPSGVASPPIRYLSTAISSCEQHPFAAQRLAQRRALHHCRAPRAACAASHSITPACAAARFGVVSILSAEYSRSNTRAQVEQHHARPGFGDQRTQLLADRVRH